MKFADIGISMVGASRSQRRMRRQELWAKAQKSAHDPRSGKPHWPLIYLIDRYENGPNGCWNYSGSKNKQGYGIICLRIDGKATTVAVSRLMWMHVYGKPPEGLDVLHRCDNPACIRPSHLWLGTHTDNMRDMIAKGRAYWQQEGLAQNPAQSFWERYRRNEVPYLGKYHRERFPDFKP